MYGPEWERTEEERKVSLVLEQVTKEVGTESITAVAIAYHLHKTPYVFRIIGGRKVDHLKQNIQALDLSLPPEQIQRIDDANPIGLGFPYIVIGQSPETSLFGQSMALHVYDSVPAQAVITPSKIETETRGRSLVYA